METSVDVTTVILLLANRWKARRRLFRDLPSLLEEVKPVDGVKKEEKKKAVRQMHQFPWWVYSMRRLYGSACPP
ncbi:hypothetical protein MHYP_G00099360 [Metynnis hypsauchen]